MDDDEILTRLAETARQENEEENRLDPRWEALAAGALPEADAEALCAETAESPAGRVRYAAFTPLGADFRSRMSEEVQQRVAPPPPAALTPPVAPPRRHWRLGVAAAAALAATILLLVAQPWRKPLPPYAVRLSGGTEELRAGEEAASGSTPVFAPGNSFELILTPEREMGEDLAVETFSMRRGEVSPWTAPFEVSSQGAVRISGVVGNEIRLSEGESTLLVVFGRRSSLPAARELPGRGGPGCHRHGRDAVICNLPVVFRKGA